MSQAVPAARGIQQIVTIIVVLIGSVCLGVRIGLHYDGAGHDAGLQCLPVVDTRFAYPRERCIMNTTWSRYEMNCIDNRRSEEWGAQPGCGRQPGPPLYPLAARTNVNSQLYCHSSKSIFRTRMQMGTIRGTVILLPGCTTRFATVEEEGIP